MIHDVATFIAVICSSIKLKKCKKRILTGSNKNFCRVCILVHIYRVCIFVKIFCMPVHLTLNNKFCIFFFVRSVVTIVTRVNGLVTWGLVGGLFLIGCFLGCCLIPLFIDDAKDVEHHWYKFI